MKGERLEVETWLMTYLGNPNYSICYLIEGFSEFFYYSK